MTAVTPENDLDTDSIELLDFDYDIPCDMKLALTNSDCPRSADWIVTLVCCGRQFLFCDYHFQRMLGYIGNTLFSDDGEGGCGKTNMEQPILSAERLDKSN